MLRLVGCRCRSLTLSLLRNYYNLVATNFNTYQVLRCGVIALIIISKCVMCLIVRDAGFRITVSASKQVLKRSVPVFAQNGLSKRSSALALITFSHQDDVPFLS